MCTCNTTCNITYNTTCNTTCIILYIIIHVLYNRMCTKGSASSLNQEARDKDQSYIILVHVWYMTNSLFNTNNRIIVMNEYFCLKTKHIKTYYKYTCIFTIHVHVQFN